MQIHKIMIRSGTKIYEKERKEKPMKESGGGKKLR
jgi:hypothetical protein